MLWSPDNPMTTAGDTIRGGAAGVATRIANNYTATAAPTADDDVTLGYASGSEWVDTTNGNSYRCQSAADGAAVWRDVVTFG